MYLLNRLDKNDLRLCFHSIRVVVGVASDSSNWRRLSDLVGTALLFEFISKFLFDFELIAFEKRASIASKDASGISLVFLNLNRSHLLLGKPRLCPFSAYTPHYYSRTR